jgi:hypothetical protein
VALLTGAGFTKTFGGLLADEMWAAVFNQPEIQNTLSVREKMLAQLNYERFYQDCMDDRMFTANEKEQVTKAVVRAYVLLDELISAHKTDAAAAFQRFVSRFASPLETREIGCYFTLNQDILVERFYSVGDPTRGDITIPGLPGVSVA